MFFFFFHAEDGMRYARESRGLGGVYERQLSHKTCLSKWWLQHGPFLFRGALHNLALSVRGVVHNLTNFYGRAVRDLAIGANIYIYIELSLLHT